MACQINYVSYVYSIASERNLHVIFYDILTHISKFGTKCNDKHMPVFFINIQALAIGL